ncbi:hypothetical protein ACFFLM_00335 [Deinococcus oregonensis]|uniref:SPW repeat-containing integral membrane domain-containing protein n=1 Tax=Deinococcus oregonensis TaxID=1805970 RepID=A0ABV6AUQ7_9DEIO
MKPIGPTAHGIIDYGAVLLLVLAPFLLNLERTPSQILYLLAGILGILTMMTAFRPGLLKLIPFPVHGGFDLVTSVIVAALPWILGFSDQTTARNLFLCITAMLVGVWLLTDWRSRDGLALT